MELHKGPENIFLQVDPDGESACDWIDGVTWCEDRLNETDIEYVKLSKNENKSDTDCGFCENSRQTGYIYCPWCGNNIE